jgi:hypothetical protein
MNIIKNRTLHILGALISTTMLHSITDLTRRNSTGFFEEAQLPVIVFMTGFLGSGGKDVHKDFEYLEKQYGSSYIFAIDYYAGKFTKDIKSHFIALFNKGKLIGTFPAVQKEELMRYIQSLQTTGKLPLDYQLIEAIRSGDTEGVKKLLQEGANPNYVLTRDPYYSLTKKETTSLFEAYGNTLAPDLKMRVKMIEILLQADANPYLKIKTKEGKTTDFYELVASEATDIELSIKALQLLKENLQNILTTIKNKTGFLPNKPRALKIRLKNYLLGKLIS